MELKDLKALVKLVKEHDIAEFELQTGDDRVLIRRGMSQEVVTVAAPVAPAPTSLPAAEAPTPVAAPAQEEGVETVNSPMVGTFYRKPSPDADAFAPVGTTIEKGQTLCLVEAMKLFNEIEAEFKCQIIEVLKEDAQPVEYGEPLFKVKRL